MANIAGLLKIHTCPIREFWSNLTKTTTRRWLFDNIGALKTRIQRLQSSDLNMRNLIESISAEDEDAMRGRDLFLEVHEDNLEILSRTQEIYLHIVGQMMQFLEPFLQMNEERGYETVDPTNVPVERVFGVLKYAEKALSNLQFGLFAQHTMAKFIKVLAQHPSIGPAKLEEFTLKYQKLRNG